MLRELLGMYYGIQAQERTVLNGVEGVKTNDDFYFTISADQKETIHMEQAALAYYLYENNYTQMAIPIQNSRGDWFTSYDNQNYMVLRVNGSTMPDDMRHGERLAQFHILGSTYQYEPQTISSYGQWKTLWIDKLTAFEKQIAIEAYDYPNAYYRELMDVLPYLIGISENAIQYMQESEYESRFHEADKGTTTFKRYSGQINSRVMWMTDLVYDHPARDLAAFIRNKLLEEEDPVDSIRDFLDAYQRLRPLSLFSWRLLYARLLFPIHLFDVIERGFISQQYEQCHVALSDILNRQHIYETRLGTFFDNAGIDYKDLQIPVLHWL